MENEDILSPLQEGGVLDGYGCLRIDESSCPPALADDLRGIAAARWLAGALRSDFEDDCYRSPIHGPIGTFDGVVAHAMPAWWRATGEASGGVPIWAPDARNPVGKCFADAAARLLSLPPPEVLDAVLRRHGLEGGREPAPQVREVEGGWAVLQHRPRHRGKGVPGVARDDSLVALWRGAAAKEKAA